MSNEDDSSVQNVPEMYLEPIRVSLTEPDYSVLDPKPSKPARPEVIKSSSLMRWYIINHDFYAVVTIWANLAYFMQAPASHIVSPVHMNGRTSASDDPFSNQSISPAEANTLFNNDDAFAAFNNKSETVCYKQLL